MLVHGDQAAALNSLTIPALRTERLDLQPLRVEHAEEMAVVLGDPALHTFIGGEPDSEFTLRSLYRRWVAGPSEPGVSWCNWVVRLRTEDCLTAWLQATVEPAPQGPVAEIAWMVGTPWQRRGIATEAARALVGWLEEQPVRSIVAHVHPDHRASAAVAAAAGLTRTDQLIDGELRWVRAAGAHGQSAK